jgi:hypothetical protein
VGRICCFLNLRHKNNSNIDVIEVIFIQKNAVQVGKNNDLWPKKQG